MPTGLVAHVQLNDSQPPRPGPGRRRVRARARGASKRTGYTGWLAMEPFDYIPDGPTCAARSIGYVAGILEALACRRPIPPRLRLVEVERYERDVRLRLPFRFGVTTVTHATQAVIRATIALPDGRIAPRRRRRDARREMVRQEPRALRRAEPRPAAAVARDRDRALQGARLRDAVRALCRHLSPAAGARRGARPQSARRLLRAGASRSRHRRRARPCDSASPSRR